MNRSESPPPRGPAARATWRPQAATIRFCVTALAVSAVLIIAAELKHRSAVRSIPEARRILPAGSWVVVPAHSAPTERRPADPNASIASGPPRMFHLDAAHRNRSPFRGPREPTIEWSANLGEPIRSAPAALPNGSLVLATLGGRVAGIGNDGSIKFSVSLTDRVYPSPLVIDDRIFIGTDDDRFVRLSSSGNVHWSIATDDDADVAATPTTDHGLVFASGNTVYFVRQDGSVVWRVKGKRKFFSSPAIGSDGTIFIGSQDDRLYAIRRVGTIRFKMDLGQDIDCSPAIDDDGTVFVGTDGGSVVAVDVESARVKWTKEVGGHVRGGVTVTRSHDVIAGVYGPSPRVVCLRGSDGSELWSFAVPGTGAKEFGVHGSPVEDADGNLYFGAQDDAVYSLTPTGQLRWKLATGGDVDAPVVLVADGALVAASDDGKLYRIVDRNP